jgi:drug/metabolite transporter (DMT)-like permease
MMHMGVHIGVGEILAAIGAVALAVSTIISQQHLSKIPLGIYSVFRTALGTIIFFFLALIIYGRDHFTDMFSPFLWRWMLVYGFVIVVLGQSFWIKGLKASTVSVASLVSSFTPLVGILAAYFILGEAPTMAHYIGGSLILVGVLLSQIGIRRQASLRTGLPKMISTSAQHNVETTIGFKGI